MGATSLAKVGACARRPIAAPIPITRTNIVRCIRSPIIDYARSHPLGRLVDFVQGIIPAAQSASPEIGLVEVFARPADNKPCEAIPEARFQLRLLHSLVVVLSIAATCSAQFPDYYKTVNCVTWVVGNIDKV